MSRVSSQTNQRQRTKSNPLILGTFSDLSLRYLTGTLGPLNEVGLNGYGGGTYTHWFQINISRPAWIIVTKGGPRPNYIQTSVYDLNTVPANGLPIFEADSLTDGLTNLNEVYFPYLNAVMAFQSDLYNTFNRLRLDRGDDRYYPLEVGSYLLCVSSTRNERIDYSVGVVVEFAGGSDLFLALEDDGLFVQETEIDPQTTVTIDSPVTADTIISVDVDKPDGFSKDEASINAGVTVTILQNSTWLIGATTGSIVDVANSFLLLEVTDGYFDTIHDHSLSEWRNAWNAQHHPDETFPDLFVPLTNKP